MPLCLNESVNTTSWDFYFQIVWTQILIGYDMFIHHFHHHHHHRWTPRDFSWTFCKFITCISVRHKQCRGFWTKKKADELQNAVDAVFNKGGAPVTESPMKTGQRYVALKKSHPAPPFFSLEVLGCPWKLVTIVSKLAYSLLRGLATYLYRGYNPFTKYHGYPSMYISTNKFPTILGCPPSQFNSHHQECWIFL